MTAVLSRTLRFSQMKIYYNDHIEYHTSFEIEVLIFKSGDLILKGTKKSMSLSCFFRQDRSEAASV